MPRGGARSRSGPLPDPDALRRDRPEDKATWIDLPAEGRKGKLPRWPLAKQVQREKTLWKREWSRPQAIMWERNGQELEVALYVRAVADAEKPNASAGIRHLVRQSGEALGTTLPGLRAHRWRIAHDEPLPTPTAKRKTSKPSSAKSRFRVIDGGGE